MSGLTNNAWRYSFSDSRTWQLLARVAELLGFLANYYPKPQVVVAHEEERVAGE